jgi:hypothetical protein
MATKQKITVGIIRYMHRFEIVIPLAQFEEIYGRNLKAERARASELHRAAAILIERIDNAACFPYVEGSSNTIQIEETEGDDDADVLFDDIVGALDNAGYLAQPAAHMKGGRLVIGPDALEL